MTPAASSGCVAQGRLLAADAVAETMTTPPATAHDPVLARMGQLLGLPIADEIDVFELARAGLAADAWVHLSASVPLPRDLFVRADYARLMITLGRRFTPPETELILRVVRLFAQAHEALGSHGAASDWLSTPRSLRPGQPTVVPWTLATTESGTRLCERLLGLGTAISAAPVAAPASDVDIDALVRGDANMSDAELDWAAALEEQRTAGVAPAGAGPAPGPDVDIDAVMSEVAVDPHELDWAAALAEQAAAGQGDAELASSDDADAILAAAAAQSNG